MSEGSARSNLIAAALYAGAIFLFAFALGTVRVLALAPAIGALAATAIEIPIVLGASWWASRRIMSRFAIPPRSAARLAAGAAAFVILMSLETALGIAVFGNPLEDQLRAYVTPKGMLGLAGQIAFAIVPWAQIWGLR